MATEENGTATAHAENGAEGKVEVMRMVLYLNVPKGRCQEAIDWYKNVFGFEEKEKVPAPKRKAEEEAPGIMHAELALKDKFHLYLADSDEAEENATQNFNIYFSTSDADKVGEKAVKAGGKIVMEIADQFWGERFGKVKDPFGYVWALSTPLKNVKHDEAAAPATAHDAAA